MMVRHLELLVEEPSMEAFLRVLLPRILPEGRTFEVHSFRSKGNLRNRLKNRLRGYARWLPDDWRIVVMLDCDNHDCRTLKEELEAATSESKLRSRSQAGGRTWQVANRVVIEELEAWYFGDWEAVRGAYPRVPNNIPNRARYRDPDAIRGGTWEAFERILKRHGYFTTGLRKVEAARMVGAHVDPERNRSRSFAVFLDVVAAV